MLYGEIQNNRYVLCTKEAEFENLGQNRRISSSWFFQHARGVNWDFNGRRFEIKVSTFERMVSGFLNKISSLLFEKAVQKYWKSLKKSRLVTEETAFSIDKFALYAIDVNFYSTNWPSGTHDKAKEYYSNKHKLSGYNPEVLVFQ